MKYLPMLSEGHWMKMCLKLTYCAFSSSPSKDSTMGTFGGFLHYLLTFKPLIGWFFLSKTWLQISVCLWLECACTVVTETRNPENKDWRPKTRKRRPSKTRTRKRSPPRVRVRVRGWKQCGSAPDTRVVTRYIFLCLIPHFGLKFWSLISKLLQILIPDRLRIFLNPEFNLGWISCLYLIKTEWDT